MFTGYDKKVFNFVKNNYIYEPGSYILLKTIYDDFINFEPISINSHVPTNVRSLKDLLVANKFVTYRFNKSTTLVDYYRPLNRLQYPNDILNTIQVKHGESQRSC